MQRLITRKSDLLPLVEQITQLYQAEEYERSWDVLEQDILQHKVKFPLLEVVARQYSRIIPFDQQLSFLRRIAETDYEGGYVLIGIILQERLSENLEETLEAAVGFIIKADKWYACDIIAERVFGVALLQHFEKSFPIVKQYTCHVNAWTRRATGIGMHYATKKGLDAVSVEKLFCLLISLSGKDSLEVKKGLGWALKTMARIHPQIVGKYRDQVLQDPQVDAWYKMKIRMGLNKANR